MLFLAFVSSQLKSNFSHPFCALSWFRFAFVILFAFLAVLLVKLLLASLTFLFQALDNVNGATSGTHTKQRIVMFIKRSSQSVLADLDLTLNSR